MALTLHTTRRTFSQQLDMVVGTLRSRQLYIIQKIMSFEEYREVKASRNNWGRRKFVFWIGEVKEPSWPGLMCSGSKKGPWRCRQVEKLETRSTTALLIQLGVVDGFPEVCNDLFGPLGVSLQAVVHPVHSLLKPIAVVSSSSIMLCHFMLDACPAWLPPPCSYESFHNSDTYDKFYHACARTSLASWVHVRWFYLLNRQFGDLAEKERRMKYVVALLSSHTLPPPSSPLVHSQMLSCVLL